MRRIEFPVKGEAQEICSNSLILHEFICFAEDVLDFSNLGILNLRAEKKLKSKGRRSSGRFPFILAEKDSGEGRLDEIEIGHQADGCSAERVDTGDGITFTARKRPDYNDDRAGYGVSR